MAVPLFEQYGNLISSFKDKSSAPYIGKIVVKEVSSLVSVNGCDRMLIELYTRSPSAKLIITSHNSSDEYLINTYIFDPTTFELQRYTPSSPNNQTTNRRAGHTNLINDICEDPCRPNIIFSVGNDGRMFEWDLFSAGSGTELVVRRQNSVILNSIACSPLHIAIGGDSGML